MSNTEFFLNITDFASNFIKKTATGSAEKWPELHVHYSKPCDLITSINWETLDAVQNIGDKHTPSFGFGATGGGVLAGLLRDGRSLREL